VYTVDKK